MQYDEIIERIKDSDFRDDITILKDDFYSKGYLLNGTQKAVIKFTIGKCKYGRD